MVRMGLMGIQGLLDHLVIEESLVKMECQVLLDQWEKKVPLEVKDHLEILVIKAHQENKVTPDYLDLKEQEVDQDLRDQ